MIYLHRYQPELFFQINASEYERFFNHPIYKLRNVSLFLGAAAFHYDTMTAPGYPHPPNTPEGMAVKMCDWIEWAKRETARVAPGKIFQYALMFHGYGYHDSNPSLRLFMHPQDAVAGLQNGFGLFTANGVGSLKQYANVFFPAFRRELDRRGLPNPIFVDPDQEMNTGIPFGDNKSMAELDDAIRADPRSRSEKINGRQTYIQYLDAYRDALGQPIGGLVHPYDTSRPETANFYPSLSFDIKDFALNECLYKYVRKYMPGTKCGNWNVFCSSNTKPSFVVRPKEHPASFNTQMRADLQIMQFYGLDWLHPRELDGFAGMKTYDTLTRMYKLSPQATPADVFIANLAWNIDASQRANPHKEFVAWPAAENGSWGDEYIAGPAKTLTFDRSVLLRMLEVFKEYNVRTIGLFEPSISDAMLTEYYYAIKGLKHGSPNTTSQQAVHS